MSTSVPSGFGHLLHPQPPPPPPPKTDSSAPFRSRLRLFVRQHPIAARACGFGDKCRRPIDPLPVIQLLMTDFSPQCEEDMRQLTNKQHVVTCQLHPVSEACGGYPEHRIRSRGNAGRPFEKRGIGAVNGETGSNLTNRYRGRILSGSTCASLFSVDQDPDPAHAPPHPRSAASREKGPSTTLMRPPGFSSPSDAPRYIPAAFFIFADLCVRSAGWYQLRFQLVDVQETEKLGSTPCLDEVWSQPFRVFAAKDFPGMRPAPYLTTKLKDLGAVGIKTREKERGLRQKKVIQRGGGDGNGPEDG
ncbi:conserved hypothetical protein [Histoplasma capsulatum G186AR]|uniref:Velvet domain-containing protein n=2 Tax=Ajellomyces capsulatus TaxID=5037 RepID=C0NY64_AJECG|nr:uncharacterized protein HCBG_07858 [Histoplasma capsulatum G186AR]EEH03732.1 conserved hypothetical protein [Histoplasma capsulatum G186AR]KAG5293695.1 velvet family protein VelC, mycelia-enriched transcript [Histoplasma capsulatum]QSS75147.1 velvet family protein VelC, mycelia-enriched transcript [Histoplasma capsulatum G186AR]